MEHAFASRQKDWEVNQPNELAKVLQKLEQIQDDFNGAQSNGKLVSLADVIVLGGCTAVEEAAKKAGHDVTVPFAAGRTDVVALGRALMNEPHFVLNAAADYGHAGQVWPKQYLSGKPAAASLATADNQEMYDLRVRAKPPNPREALAIAMIRGELLQD